MHFTHTDGRQRVQIGSGERITDIEVFMAARPYLDRRLAINYGCGQAVRVYDEPELAVVSRMVAAYYNFEQDNPVSAPLSDPFFNSSLWNTCLFMQDPDGGIMPLQEEGDNGASESHEPIYCGSTENSPKGRSGEV